MMSRSNPVRSSLHASEGGHWYTREGEPLYQIPKADGEGMRPVTLRDARKLKLVPGVSGILNCAAKPGLDRWLQEQVLLAALTLPRGSTEPEETWLERVRVDSKETGKKAADRGTAIHKAIQEWYDVGYCEPEYGVFCQSVSSALHKWTPSVFIPEKSFACPMGFGGKVDLQAYEGFVADAKTKEFTGEDLASGKQLAWDDHCMQLSAYRYGLNMPKARCANVFVSVNEPGLVILHEWTEEELERGWRMFLALLQFWQAKNRYNSSWLPERKAA